MLWGVYIPNCNPATGIERSIRMEFSLPIRKFLMKTVQRGFWMRFWKHLQAFSECNPRVILRTTIGWIGYVPPIEHINLHCGYALPQAELAIVYIRWFFKSKVGYVEIFNFLFCLSHTNRVMDLFLQFYSMTAVETLSLINWSSFSPANRWLPQVTVLSHLFGMFLSKEF